MRRVLLAILAAVLFPLAALAGQQDPKIDLSPAAVERGKALFFSTCNQCHGLKYYRGKDFPTGISPQIDAQSAKATFGVIPPDLSTMAIAQGKRLNGVKYIYRLLTTYYQDEKGEVLNKAFAEKTKSTGRTAMPQPIPDSDLELKQKAMDISVFLLAIAEPADKDSRRIGTYVLIYMVILTSVLFFLNRATWKEIKTPARL